MIAFLAMAAIAAPIERTAVVLVTDCGASIDDQFAIVHLALSPRIELRGIVSTLAGNLEDPAAESSAKSAREVLGWLDLKDPPPVIVGSSTPVSEPKGPKSAPAIDFLIAESRRDRGGRRLSVLVIGTMTDVALALKADPGLADRIEIVAMGFNEWNKGGDVWNVKNDVAAWQAVLHSRIPIVVGDDATTRGPLRLSLSDAKTRFSGRGRASKSLFDAYSAFLEGHAESARSLSGSADAFPIWDEVVVAHLLGLTRSETRPRPRLRGDMSFDHDRPEGSIAWITEVDADRLWKDLQGTLAARK